MPGLRRRAAPFPRPGWPGAACGESVVSAVPNPKWLLRNGNPIKVLLVYLSSSGLFITVQMAATFARHSSVLARARRTEARAPQSLCLHLRGAAGPPAPAPPRHPLYQPNPSLDRVGTRHVHRACAPGICTGRLHGALAYGICAAHLHKFFTPFICTRHLKGAFAPFICTGHLHRVLAPGICSRRWRWAFARGICVGFSHDLSAPGICMGRLRRVFTPGISTGALHWVFAPGTRASH